MNARKEGLCAAVIASGDPPPVFDPSEAVFDFVELLVERLVIGLRTLAFFFGGMQGSMPFAKIALDALKLRFG